jgi:hypothetical protein
VLVERLPDVERVPIHREAVALVGAVDDSVRVLLDELLAEPGNQREVRGWGGAEKIGPAVLVRERLPAPAIVSVRVVLRVR